MKFAEIIRQYSEGAITLEQANAALKNAGATFHLADLTDEEREAKRQRENEEGTIDIGRGNEPILPKTPDMRRRKELAGQVVRQNTKTGVYDVTYDEDGYAVKAKRVQMA